MEDVHPKFQNSKVAYNICVFYIEDYNRRAGRDILLSPVVKVEKPQRRKRSRDEWESEENDSFFKEIYDIMKNEDVIPTFLTLIGTKIRKQMASTDLEHNSYYNQIQNIIVDFEFMLMNAENIFRKGHMEHFYYYILDDIGKLLKLSKHQILYFQLELNIKNQ